MLSLDDIHADMEADRRSRESEIRLIERLCTESDEDNERSMLRRSLVILTYAHLEGFTKFVLYAYVSFINARKINCADAAIPIAAASLSKVFAALRNPDSKHKVFKKKMPEDTKLHLAAREQAFIENYETLCKCEVKIPDDLIDTKSNLSPDVLKKLLFQLGLPFDQVNQHQSTISELLGVRNHIAHGDRLKVPTATEMVKYISSALVVMSFLQSEVYGALQRQLYRRDVVAIG